MFMCKIEIYLFYLLFFIVYQGNVITGTVEDESLINLKETFTNAVMDTILKFSPFQKKFDVPYLGSANSMYYAKEIAKAIAYAPQFSEIEAVEDYVLERIAKFTLPCSLDYCEDIWCIVSSIADIMADVSIKGGFVTPKLTEQVVAKKANNLAGNVLWRLSRVPDPDPDVLVAQVNLSPKISNRIFKFIKLLSTVMYDYPYISSFYKNTGLDTSNSAILATPVCGSTFFDFKIDLIPEISSHIANIYTKTQKTYTRKSNSTIDSTVMSSIVSETIALKLLKQKFFESNANLEEVSNDIMKLMMVGITSSRMSIHGSNVGRNSFKMSMM